MTNRICSPALHLCLVLFDSMDTGWLTLLLWFL